MAVARKIPQRQNPTVAKNDRFGLCLFLTWCAKAQRFASYKRADCILQELCLLCMPTLLVTQKYYTFCQRKKQQKRATKKTVGVQNAFLLFVAFALDVVHL